MTAGIAQRIGFLAALPEEDAQALLASADRLTVSIDQEVLRQGQHNDSLYIVAEGLLHVRRQSQGHEVLLGRLEPGSVFGEVSLFDPGPTTATVRAVSEGVLLCIGRRHLEDFIRTHPAAAAQVLLAIVGEMARRVRRLDERLVDSIVWGLLK
jgi:CRP-like cAMP-binding protein